MKTFYQILTESQFTNFTDNIVKHLQDVGRMWAKENPDEGIDTKYMRVNFDRDHYAVGFMAAAEKNGNVSKGAKRMPKGLKERGASCQVHGCFYNALDFMHRFGAEYPKIKLAYGIMADQKAFDELKTAAAQDPSKERVLTYSTGPNTTTHAFLIDGKKAIDPTMGGNSKDLYYYEIVPEKVWRKFNYKQDDSNWDARQFANIIYKDIKDKQKKFPFEKMFNKIGGI
jgi:hypothetical protein